MTLNWTNQGVLEHQIIMTLHCDTPYMLCWEVTIQVFKFPGKNIFQTIKQAQENWQYKHFTIYIKATITPFAFILLSDQNQLKRNENCILCAGNQRRGTLSFTRMQFFVHESACLFNETIWVAFKCVEWLDPYLDCSSSLLYNRTCQESVPFGKLCFYLFIVGRWISLDIFDELSLYRLLSLNIAN